MGNCHTRRVRLLILVLIAAVCVSPAAGAGEVRPSFDRAGVDSFVRSYLDRHGLAGASVAVVRDGRVLHTAGYGKANGKPATATSPMPVASVSKSFTAFAVLQLVQAKKVRLDEPVTRYLPEFKVDDSRGNDITVRHVLSHTSGLPNPTIVPPADDAAEDVAHMRDWQLAAAPGTRYAYSNANYRVAARLVEVVTGTPFATYLQRQVFTPLGMSDTVSANTTRDDVPGLQDGHITAYGLALPAREMEQVVTGSGGVVTTAADMASWLALQTGGGQTRAGRQLLSRSLLDTSHTPQPSADRYGLGWTRSSTSVDPARISHGGSFTRASAEVDLVPSSGYGVAVMLDSFTPTHDHAYAISAGIIDITEGRSPSPGMPKATLIDMALGLMTLAALVLTARGARRARHWAEKRASWPLWRYALRLLPSLVFPALTVWIIGVLPLLQHNSATPLDVLLLWPAGMLLVLALGVSGAVLVVLRLVRRRTNAATP